MFSPRAAFFAAIGAGVVLTFGTTTAGATAGVLVTSVHQWEDGSGMWHIAGTVENTLPSSIDDVELSLDLEDSSNAVLQTATAGSLIGVLDQGQSSPFVAVVAPPSGFTHAVATVESWATAAGGADSSLVAVSSSTCSDQTISGTVQNTGPPVGGVEVAVEYLDSGGNVLDVSSVPLAGTLGTGAVEDFTVTRSANAPACHQFELVAASPIVMRNLTATTSGPGQGSVTLPAGASCGAGCVSLPIASTVTLAAVPGRRSVFSRWAGACRGASATCVVTMNDTEAANAVFAVETRVVRVELEGRGSIRSTPAGIDCPQRCTAPFPIGTRVVLGSHSPRGWHLVGWSGKCGRAEDCAVVLNVARTVRVSLAPDNAPLWDSVRNFIGRRSGRVSVAVYDFDSGTTYLYDPAEHFNAASTVKLQILATALYRAQQANRWLTPQERAEAVPMIEESDNDAAEELWEDDGDNPAVQRFDDLVPMSNTIVSPAWGLTQITAPDCVLLERRYVAPNSLLDNRSRAYGLGLMERVTPSQRWGVSGGVPASATVALKNGWLPQPATAWTVNSTGWVDGDGRDYVIAVLTDQNSSFDYGISTIEGISARVWARLTPG